MVAVRGEDHYYRSRMKLRVEGFHFVCLAFLAFFASSARAEAPLELYHFEDSSRSLTIEDFLAKGDAIPWERVKEDPPRYGYTKARHWFRFRIPEVENGWTDRNLILEIPYNYLRYVSLYTTTNGLLLSHLRTGTAVPVSERDKSDVDNGSLNFRILPPRSTDNVYYISAEAENFPLSLPVRTLLARTFLSQSVLRHLFLGMFFGCLVLALIYNAFLGASLRSRLYLYYSSFVASTAFLFLGHEGFSIQYLWPNSPWWAVREMHTFSGLSILFYTQFVRCFLETRTRTPVLDRALLFLVAVSTARSILLLGPPSQFIAMMGQLSLVSVNLLVLAIAAIYVIQGQRSARIFLMSSIAFNVGMALYVFQEANLIRFSPLLDRAPHIGVAFEVILLSLALADRIRNTNAELARSNKSLAEQIRERERAERVLEQQRIAIIQSERLGALGRMAGGIAHEINNPLAIIHGNAQLLKRLSVQEQGPVLDAAKTIEQTSLRISQIVKSMRALARQSNADPLKQAWLSAIMTDAVALCRQHFKTGDVDLQWTPPEPDVPLLCRSAELSQVLINLLHNAYDAVEPERDKWVRVEARTESGKAFVSVTDSGRGISPEIRSRILEPFFTTKEVGKGTGLGLSIARSILESHDGSIWLDEQGPNTRFVFTLPVADSPPG